MQQLPDVFNYSVKYKYTTYKMRNSARCIQLFGKGINILHITGATVAWCIQLFGKGINILHIKCMQQLPDVFNYSVKI